MRNIKWIAALLVLFIIWIAGAMAQTGIISAEELKKLMNNTEDLVIIDANKSKSYQASHIKGAVNIYHTNLYQDGDIAGLIKAPEELAKIFGENGITENSKIIIYDDGSQKYSSRTYWILKYLGAKDVNLLHKDMKVWSKVRLPLASSPSKVTPATFNVDPAPALLATTGYVNEVLENPDVVLVDVRTSAEFTGTAKNSTGHIPGAININYTELLTETGAFKDAAELGAIAAENGITPDKEIIFYCRTSVRGAVSFVAFKDILGYEKVKVYDGAYLEWAATNPVVQ